MVDHYRFPLWLLMVGKSFVEISIRFSNYSRFMFDEMTRIRLSFHTVTLYILKINALAYVFIETRAFLEQK